MEILFSSNVGQKALSKALKTAASNGYAKVITVLVDNRVGDRVRKENLESALIKAASNGHYEVVGILAGKGVSGEELDMAPALKKAASKGHVKVAEFLIKGGAKLGKLTVAKAKALVNKGMQIPASNKVRMESFSSCMVEYIFRP